ncbi:MAG: hypothetical protein WBB28_21755 [Crinalium sp.]
MSLSKSVFLATIFGITGFAVSVNAQTWRRNTSNSYKNVVVIVKPHSYGNCQGHKIRSDGRVYEANKGNRGKFLIVDQVALLTGKTQINQQDRKIWQVLYKPSRTLMWLHNCDISIPRSVD